MINTLSRTKHALPSLSANATLRWDLISRFLDQYGPFEHVLEVGCGQGGVATRLALRADRYEGYEPDSTSWEVARQRLERYSSATVTNAFLPEPSSHTVNLLCAFEVLEHIKDDSDALHNWAQWVKPDGHILISVPANQNRFSQWDRAVGHYRRYSREELTEKIESAGFRDVRVLGYGMPLGYLLEAVRNRIISNRDGTHEERTSGSGRAFQPADWMSQFIRLGTFPFRLMQRPFVDSRWATGLVAVGRRAS